MIKRIVPFLFAVIALASCKKSSDSNEYTVNAVVLDVNSRVPVAAATVRIGFPPFNFTDSAVSDGSGRVSFRFKKEGAFKATTVLKSGLLSPYGFGGFYASYNDRTDTLLLARPSFVTVITHKANTYLPGDSVHVQVSNDYTLGTNFNLRTLSRDKTEVPDKTFGLRTFYQQLPPANGNVYVPFGTTKLYFQWDIIRAGNIITSKTDSTDVIQFGNKTYTVNY